MIHLPRWTNRVGAILAVGGLYLMLFRAEEVARWVGVAVFCVGVIVTVAYRMYESNTIEIHHEDGRVERTSVREFVKKPQE